MKSAASLRKQYPGKYIFTLSVAAPEKGTYAAEFEGTLPVSSREELTSFVSRMLDMIERSGATVPRSEVGPGEVRVLK